MKYKYLALLFFIIYGCSSLDKTVIQTTERFSFEPLLLIPDWEIYDLRIDLIRQTEKKEVNDSTTKTVDVSYHPLGFYLGNGLFIDLNDNLSLLIPHLLQIGWDENFAIKRTLPGLFSNHITLYEKSDNMFTTNVKGFLGGTSKTLIERKGSVLYVNPKYSSRYQIIESENSLTLDGYEKATIHKSESGYFLKSWFSKREYKQIGNEIHIGNRYIVRNRGDMIEILYRGFWGNEKLWYRIIHSHNKIFVFTDSYNGLEIGLNRNNINVMRNSVDIGTYSREKIFLREPDRERVERKRR